MKCVFLKQKEAWVFDLYMMLIMLCLLNYGGGSGCLLLYGVAKYCKKLHPTVVRSSGSSHVWRKLLEIREEVEHDIWWQIKARNSSFWFDNWTKQGALFFTEGENARDEEIEVKEFIENGSWKIEKLRENLSEEMVFHIVKNIKPNNYALNDKPWWMGSSIGAFSVKSAYHIL